MLPLADLTTIIETTTSPEVAGQGVTLFEQAFTKASAFKFSELSSQEWLTLGEQIGLRGGLVIVLMFAAWTVAGWASTGIRASLTKLKFDQTLTFFLAKMARWGILCLAAVACLSKFGVETASFAAVLGAMGFAIGLAFQGTLSNFAAGAMLLVFRPYKVGDTVNIAGYTGKVDEIELFTTTIDTFDHRRIIIPNGSIFGSVIENITHHKLRRVDVEVGVCYAADIDATRRALELAVDSLTCIRMDPAPKVVVLGFGASSVDWSVRVWGLTTDYWDIKQVLIRAIKLQLDEAGIEIPFPQMDIHVKTDEPRSHRLVA